MSYHAKLAPSAAERWINCPASLRICADIPEETSPYAEAGRLAHKIAETKARKRLGTMTKKTYDAQIKKLRADPIYTPDMDSSTDLYIEALETQAMSFEAPPFCAFEIEVPIGVITGERKDDIAFSTGTADCIMISGDTLWITDYKNGAGVIVSAEDNPQMKLYALGALHLYGLFFGRVTQIKVTIVQPNAGGVSTWTASRADVEAWGREVATPAAARALSATLDDSPGTPGAWCQTHFCPARCTCRARAEQMFSLAQYNKALPPLITPAEIGEALTLGATLVAWYKDLKDHALQACLTGNGIPGYKAVAGRSAREWGNIDVAFKALQKEGIPEAILYERRPVTPPALEKLIAKKTFTAIAGPLVVTRPGKPTLAPASDKRPAYDPAKEAFSDVNN